MVQRSIAHFVRACSDAAKAVTLPPANGITDHLLGWIVENLCSVSATQGSGFRRFMSYILPGYTVPSRTSSMRQLKLRYESAMSEVKCVLTKAEGIALSTHIWTSSATQAYNTVSGHYDDEEWKMCVVRLETVAFPGSPH